MQDSLPTLQEIVSLTEKEEEEKIIKEVDKRRMRLAAGSPDVIKNEVGREVWGSSTVQTLHSYPLLSYKFLPSSVASAVRRNP